MTVEELIYGILVKELTEDVAARLAKQAADALAAHDEAEWEKFQQLLREARTRI